MRVAEEQKATVQVAGVCHDSEFSFFFPFIHSFIRSVRDYGKRQVVESWTMGYAAEITTAFKFRT